MQPIFELGFKARAIFLSGHKSDSFWRNLFNYNRKMEQQYFNSVHSHVGKSQAYKVEVFADEIT